MSKKMTQEEVNKLYVEVKKLSSQLLDAISRKDMNGAKSISIRLKTIQNDLKECEVVKE